MELIAQDQMAQIVAIETTAKATNEALASAEETGSMMLKAIVLSKGMAALRKQIGDGIIKEVMELQGSPLGFRTDKDSSGGYPLSVVREVFIEATLRGFRMVGNEVNIIAGRFYPTVEGYQRVVKEQVDNLEISLEVPEFGEDVAYVPAFARFTYRGRQIVMERTKRDGRDLRLMVKVNKGMGHDAILGKARSRLYRLIAERISGIVMPDDEPQAAEVVIESRPVDDNPLPAWSAEYALEIAKQVEDATDREQIEKIYRRWKPLARGPEMESQLANRCSSKASQLKES